MCIDKTIEDRNKMLCINRLNSSGIATLGVNKFMSVFLPKRRGSGA
ncbi:hypothetical protein [Bartonella doshiae]|nr:hypothetical protein [Bartonella doshiae]